MKRFDQCLKLNPHSHQAHNNRGLCLQFLERVDEAKLAYEEALRIKPDYQWPKDNLRQLAQNPSAPFKGHIKIVDYGSEQYRAINIKP